MPWRLVMNLGIALIVFVTEDGTVQTQTEAGTS